MSSVVLPEGWCDTKLGAAIDYGKAVKKELSQVNSDMWILELEDIEKDSSKLIQRVLVADRPFKSTKNSFSKGDILYGKLRPYLNKVIIADTDGVCTTEIIPINGEPLVNNKFLFYWLRSESFLSYVNAVSYGVNMPRLGTTDGLAAPFYLAPLAEQKVIAAKLDELLAQVDILKTRLTTIPKLLKRFRQSVLAAAVSGKLTEEWRSKENISRDVELTFENYPIKKLSEIGAVTGGLTKNSKREDFAFRKPYLRVANVYTNEVRLNDVYEIGLTEKEFQKVKLEYRDLLIVEGNGSLDQIGRAAMWENQIKDCVHQNHLIRWRAAEGIEPKYVLIFLMSPEGRKQIVDIASSTTGLHTLSVSKVSALSLVTPMSEEQTEIVRRVEQLFAFADQIEQQVKNAQSRVNNLTQSILAKAFRGELTADWRAANPDLITCENSAQALLAKIKAERDKPKKTPKQQAMFSE